MPGLHCTHFYAQISAPQSRSIQVFFSLGGRQGLGVESSPFWKVLSAPGNNGHTALHSHTGPWEHAKL